MAAAPGRRWGARVVDASEVDVTTISLQAVPPPDTPPPLEVWSAGYLTAMSPKNRHNLEVVFRAAGVDHLWDIASVELINLSAVKGSYYRIEWQESRQWQRPSAWDPHPQAWPLRGGHGTTDVGAIGILQARAIVPVEYVGIYGLMTHSAAGADAESREWLRHTLEKVALSNKNQSGILFEVRARCRYQPLSGGSTYAEDELVRAGVASHYGSGKHSRWQLPYPFVEFVGIWVPCEGYLCDEIPGCRRR